MSLDGPVTAGAAQAGRGTVLIWIAFWAIVWGVIGALIAPRKGWTPGGGFALCALFAIFGVAYLATRPDVEPLPDRSGPLTGEERVRVYASGQTQKLTNDVKDAREHGWQVIRRDYRDDGSAVITFGRRGPSEWST